MLTRVYKQPRPMVGRALQYGHAKISRFSFSFSRLPAFVSHTHPTSVRASTGHALGKLSLCFAAVGCWGPALWCFRR